MATSNELTSGTTNAPSSCAFATYDTAPDSGTAGVGIFGATSLSTEDYGSSHFSSLHDSLEHRPSALSDAFQSRWRQAWAAMQAHRWCEEPDEESLALVRNQLGVLIKLLSEESNQDADLYSIGASSPKLSPLAQFLIYEEMLTKLNNWLKTVGVADIPLFFQVFQIYQFVLEQVTPANCRLVLQQSRFGGSLTELLEVIPEYLSVVYTGTQKVYKTMFEECLVQLLHTIAGVLVHDPQLHRSMLVMDDDSSSGGSTGQSDIKISSSDRLPRGTRWPLFELLVGFLHRPNLVGERARDAMLMCLGCTQRFEYLGAWIVDETDFCPLLATGLSGLFSELPRTLFSERMSLEHFRVYHEMLESTSELQLFLRCLRFCDDALSRSHPYIQVQFHDFFFNGFLLPVLGPALHQSVTAVPICDLETLPQYANTVDEIITTTAYFDLFLRTIGEPFLVKLFIEFVLHDYYDNGVSMLDIFLTRFAGKSKVSLVTTILLHTMLETNCDDLRWTLVTQFLGENGGHSRIGLFKAETPGVNANLMMNYTRHWMSFSARKLLKSCLMNYLHSTGSTRRDQFVVYLNYLQQVRDSLGHFHRASHPPTAPWLVELTQRTADEPVKLTPQLLTQVYSAKSREKTQFLSICPFRIKNCHYNEEHRHITINGTIEEEQQIKNIKTMHDDSPPVGSFIDTLCRIVRNFFKNDAWTNLHVTELFSKLLHTPDKQLFGLLFDETLARPVGVPCLLHTLQILSVEAQRYADAIPNFDALFLSVKRGLFPSDDGISLTSKSSSNSTVTNSSSSTIMGGDGKGRKRFTLRSFFNRLSMSNNSSGLGVMNGFVSGGSSSSNSGSSTHRRSSNASLASVTSSQVQVNQSSTTVRYFNQSGKQHSAGNQYDSIIHNLIIFDHFLLELSAILLEISVIVSLDDE